ncbi:cellulase family glycosylhydrolase [Streptomyces sp. ISL-36]|uniref:cellulase family glycosylhydrolase n=1 Tax=Streptomyces sp. ISL-36 TaxID=2819182 RepID=UPI001BE74C52|nr:cellulase family glycosylhydrolase [Streptomyces sp. ISL-36]MBT2439469.1 cellulase family glycosylhydrolase [Streptomyces sp. ISL-36]
MATTPAHRTPYRSGRGTGARAGARTWTWGLALLALVSSALGAGVPARAAGPHPYDERAAELTVTGTRFVDGYGREVVLRGFNVSGETKLAENGGLPFADVEDARKSARAVRELGGANSVRFLLSWAAAEPVQGQVDEAYLAQVTAQMREFLAVGLRVYPDFHQDLFSRHVFDKDSWYSGDGAPRWVVQAGGYPREFCGVCAHWGQNITQNRTVKDAMRDFWTNRNGIQDAFLDTAQTTMAYLADHLERAEFAGIAGFDPYNEPYAGQYASGQDGSSWEKGLLWPFYERFRARMDAAGWQSKPALVEPNMFWNSNLSFMKQPGGLGGVGTLGPRYVFNTHFYDQARMSGFFDLTKAKDGEYAGDFNAVRARSTDLGTPAVVSEFGHPLTGTSSDKAPSVLKGQYQALDSALDGRSWWQNPAAAGPVLSATQWQWDIYSGRHHEAMNDNPQKIRTDGDAWNDEDLSAVRLDDRGVPQLRQDARLLDRLYPSAVAGRTLAFLYEDRSRDAGRTLTWSQVPSSLPASARLIGADLPYGLLVWRGSGASAPTELHLPAGFDPATTTVVSDLGTVTGPGSAGAIAVAPEPGGTNARRILLSGASEGVHFALVSAAPATAEQRAAVREELGRWVERAGFPAG